MIPSKKVEELILKHKNLEGELSSGNIDKNLFATKSKEYSDLNEIIDQSKIDNISMKDSLAGHISSRLALKDKEDYLMDNLLLECANEYDKAFPSANKLVNHIGTAQRLVISALWVIFQKKHEFNPMHDHSGVFSFVIWMKIPTDWKEQAKLPFMEGQKHSSVSNFEITYPDTDWTLNQCCRKFF